MANEKWSTWASMGTLAGTEKLVGLDGSANEYTTPADIKTYIGITSPVAYNPVFTGFGTVSAVTAYSWREGSTLCFEIVFTSGVATAVEARVELGFNGTSGNITSASTYPTLQVCGNGGAGTNTTPYVPLIEASKTYITIGFGVILSKDNGDAIAANGHVISLNGKVRITGW